MHKPKDATIRSIAIFEAAKGLLVLAAGFGLLSLLHSDVQKFAESLVRRSHLNPARHYPQIFINWSAHVTDQKLMMFALGAAVYATIRLAEAYGLWHKRAWAEWFALISSGLYLPVEIYELGHRPSPIKAAVFLLNLLIVIYFARERFIIAPRHAALGEPDA